MRTRITVLVLIILTGFALCGAAQTLPRVHLITTGGTIAGGVTGSLKAEDLLGLVPDLAKVARLTSEDFVNIGSSRMTPEIQSPWLGPVGYVDGGQVSMMRRPARHLTLQISKIEPRVDLLTLVSGSDGHLERAAVAAGSCWRSSAAGTCRRP